MKRQLRSLPRRAAALFLALALAAPSALAHAGEQTLQTAIPVLDGLTYYNTVTVNNDSRVESFSLELEADSSVTPILVQGSGSVYGAVTINTAVSRAGRRDTTWRGPSTPTSSPCPPACPSASSSRTGCTSPAGTGRTPCSSPTGRRPSWDIPRWS